MVNELQLLRPCPCYYWNQKQKAAAAAAAAIPPGMIPISRCIQSESESESESESSPFTYVLGDLLSDSDRFSMMDCSSFYRCTNCTASLSALKDDTWYYRLALMLMFKLHSPQNQFSKGKALSLPRSPVDGDASSMQMIAAKADLSLKLSMIKCQDLACHNINILNLN